MESAISKIKQPEPSVLVNNSQYTDAEGKKYKVINYNPNIGVVNTPQLSRTPLRDWIELKRKENPYTVYKLTPKDNTPNTISSIGAIGIILCGIASAFKLLKKNK